MGWSCASNVNQLRKLSDKKVEAPDPTQLYTARSVLEIPNISFWMLTLSLAGWIECTPILSANWILEGKPRIRRRGKLTIFFQLLRLFRTTELRKIV